MTVRSATPGDDAAVDRVVRAAFDDEGDQVAAIWAELGPLGHLRASLVAVVGAVDGADGGADAVVGHVGLSRAWVDARRALVEVLVLSPLSVLPEHQGRGHGTALVAAAVDTARAAGTPVLLLEGSPTYYGARGFTPAALHGLLPASVRVPAAAFQAVFLDGWESWMAGRLVYPDVWWRHEGVGLRDPLLAELEGLFGRSS
ncbi:GNAT family N-acetyltransferase [Nocardioides taihuensis]|uniref:GNAT family N-acetyltransferase n=1 Tax=Nocardioides taihuensis TaxID=1835606 RepID=A0ABW0BN89_9ACTN